MRYTTNDAIYQSDPDNLHVAIFSAINSSQNIPSHMLSKLVRQEWTSLDTSVGIRVAVVTSGADQLMDQYLAQAHALQLSRLANLQRHNLSHRSTCPRLQLRLPR